MRNYGGYTDMTEPAEYLTQNERELLARRPEFELAETIQTLSALSLRLSAEMDDTVGRVRAAHPELIRKIGQHTRQTLGLLDMLSRVELEEPEPAVSTPEPIVETVPIPRPTVPVPEVIELTQTPAASVESIVAVEAFDAKVLTAQGAQTGWLSELLGENWSERLKVEATASAREIADAIMVAYPQKYTSKIELCTQRIMVKLEGKSFKDVSDFIPSDNANAANAYFSLLKKRLTSEEPFSTPVKPLKPAKESFEIVHTEPETQLEPELETSILAPVIDSAELKTLIEKEIPTLTDLAETIAEKLELTGSERMALKSFLDAKNKTDMTPIKEKVLKVMRDHVRRKLNDASLKLDQDEAATLRQVFGVYVQSGTPVDKDPISLYELAANSRLSYQKTEASTRVYQGLAKLFPEAVIKTPEEASVPELTIVTVEEKVPEPVAEVSFINAALQPDLLTDEAFTIQREELFAQLKTDNILSAEQIEVLRERVLDRDDKSDRTQSAQLKETMKELQFLVMDANGVNSGNDMIDTAFKQFISPNYMMSGLDALRANLPHELRYNPQAIERILTAGLHAVYKNKAETAA